MSEKKSKKIIETDKELTRLKSKLESDSVYVEKYRQYVKNLYAEASDQFAHNNAIQLAGYEEELDELKVKIAKLEKEKSKLDN
ncbi:hypothetical protein [Tenacibaculum mesophilum]|uniref:hypothetical protein n=1 Tax=Tenacibaculum mesophilum TaxID=104268 RepID=UPI003748E3C1